MSCFLGIDAGTSGVKASVMDASGNLLGKGYGECDLITPRPSWVAQDPQDWWDACDTAISPVSYTHLSRRRREWGLR